MPTSPRGSKSCAGRNRPCGDRTRSAESWRSTDRTERTGYSRRDRRRLVRLRAGFRLTRAGVKRRRRLAAALGWQRATGIDSFNGHGDKDGYRNLSGRLRGDLEARSAVTGARRRSHCPGEASSMASIRSRSLHADTLDNSRNRLGGRAAVGATRIGGAAVERPPQRLAARFVQPQLSRRRVPQPHQRHAPDA